MTRVTLYLTRTENCCLVLWTPGLRRTRCRLPVAVDVTASFVEIMLNDAYLNPEAAAPRSDHELRLMYAMAVVRLVNGIVVVASASRRPPSSCPITTSNSLFCTKNWCQDVSRTGRTTILARAQSAEWPQLFVDLRHEASHQAACCRSL